MTNALRLLDAPVDRLYPRCLFCGSEFPRSALFDRVPPGNRLAYDPARGRIWSICGRCRRWNLIPLEERLDALDTLERVVTDRAMLRAATDNVALYDVDDLAILRIGRAPVVERAAWRYGRELLARGLSYGRRRTRLAAFTAGAVAFAGETIGAWKLDRDWGPSGTADILRWQRFGSVAWRGRTACPFCASVLHTLHFDSSWWLYPRIDDGRLIVGVPCTRCDPWTPEKVFDLTGEDAHLVLRRVLAYQQVGIPRDREVHEAASIVQRAGSADRLLQELSTGRSSLWRLGRERRIALQIALDHVAEKRMLELRLEGIEAEWRVEEDLARIVDEELS